MNSAGKLFLMLIVLIVLFYIIILVIRYLLYKTFMVYLKDRNYQLFDKFIKNIFIKMLFPPYNLEYLKLNRYILEDDGYKVDQQFNILLRAAKASQKEDIFLKAFEYYAFNGNKKKAKKYFDELKKLGDLSIVKHATLIYDVFILDDINHIEELEEDFDNLPFEQKKFHAQLLFIQYKNKNDYKKQEYYAQFLTEEKNN